MYLLKINLIFTRFKIFFLIFFNFFFYIFKPAYGEDSSLSALTFMPPVTLTKVSRPDKSVTWTILLMFKIKIWIKIEFYK